MPTANELQRQPLPKAEFQTKFTIFLLYGFFFLDKIFVYLSFPFTFLLAFDRRVFFDRAYEALTKQGYLSGFTWALLISTMFGIAEVVYGLMVGNPVTTALEVLVFNLAPWFVFLGIVAGIQRPDAARDYIKFLAYFHAIVTPAYYLFLRHVNFTVGGMDFGIQPGSGSLVLLGLFCFEKNLARYWFPILVCSFDTIAAEMRADWVGLGIALVVWAVATGQVKRIVAMTAILVSLMTIGFIADVRIPALPGRGGEISARDTVGRALSGIDPKLAQEYSRDATTYAGTIQWRQNWWKAIREKVFSSPVSTIFGLGYGYPIGDLVPYLRNTDIRSPHSVFYFNLAFGGFLGIFIFAMLQLQLLLLTWQTFKHTGQIFGFACCVFLLVDSMFGNFFEAPQRAMPTYILYGLCVGPLFIASAQRGFAIAAENIRRSSWMQTPLAAAYRPTGSWPAEPAPGDWVITRK